MASYNYYYGNTRGGVHNLRSCSNEKRKIQRSLASMRSFFSPTWSSFFFFAAWSLLPNSALLDLAARLVWHGWGTIKDPLAYKGEDEFGSLRRTLGAEELPLSELITLGDLQTTT